MYKRQIDSFRLDRTYGYQHYPILTIPDNIDLIDAPSDSCCTQRCPYVNYCTLEVPYFEKLNIGFDDIIAAFPSDLLVSAVYWQHDLFTWMCISDSDNPAENYYPTDDRTIVFAENQRVGLRILKNDEGIVTYIGLELETVKTEGVDFILYLARTAQACTLTPLFFYEKTFSKPIQPMLLNSADFEK